MSFVFVSVIDSVAALAFEENEMENVVAGRLYIPIEESVCCNLIITHVPSYFWMD